MGSLLTRCSKSPQEANEDSVDNKITTKIKKSEVEHFKRDKNLQKLIAGAHPEEVGGISAYLLQHMNRDLDRGSYNKVEISVNIINLLLDNCRKVSSWTVLVQNYFEMVKRLLQTEEERLESLGTELFQRHINLHYDVGNTLYKEYNIIAKKFVEFMGRENENTRRLNGFTGISVMCTNLLLKNISKNTDKWNIILFKKILEFLLGELLYTLKKENYYVEETKPETEPELTEPLVNFNSIIIAYIRELVIRCNLENLVIIVNTIFTYLSNSNLWNCQNEFITNLFITIMDESSEEKLDVFLHRLIIHIKNIQESSSTFELVGIAKFMANFVTLFERHQETDLQKSVVSFSPDASKINTKIKKQNFMDILELIQMSIEMSKTRNDIKLIGEYQDKLIETTNKLSCAMPNKLKINSVITSGASMPIMIAEKPFFLP
uniref:Uncharacterized protein n=1 Tax=Meloidogyne enterolobii TaxID=390850 RepID=A0A6V7TTD8_MELEN|nr:unnamed protein product [Meloidogyne enterolobii]